VEQTPKATHSKIVLEASKDLVGEILLRNDSDPHQLLWLEELETVFYRCKELHFPHLQNKVTTFKYLRRNYGLHRQTLRCQHLGFCPTKSIPRKFLFSKCLRSAMVLGSTWLSVCNLAGISSMLGSCPTMSNASPSGPPWSATYTTEPTSAS
jgi:hypothetical protein